MAALSIQDSPDQATAAGRVQLHRHTVADYFLEEVLSRQPPDVVEFMLATSILDELSVAVCTSVWGQGSTKMLEFLYGAHMFVAIVDDQARTYRYHHLIREVLQTELHAPDHAWEQRPHEAAARYLIEAGQTGAAARHLLAAGRQAAAFSLLSEGVVRDVLTNPTVAARSTSTRSGRSCSRTPPSSCCRCRRSCSGEGRSNVVRRLPRSPSGTVSTQACIRSWPTAGRSHTWTVEIVSPPGGRGKVHQTPDHPASGEDANPAARNAG